MNAPSKVIAPEIRPAQGDDFAAIVELLTGCALPANDLSAEHLVYFFVARVGDRLVGVAGVEPLESVGLLRSLAVAQDFRGGGLAQRLVAACEERAQDLLGVSDLYLLTTTAADYFLRRGYHELARESVPGSVAGHPQFRGLCPASARCLGKKLTDHLANDQAKGVSMTNQGLRQLAG